VGTSEQTAIPAVAMTGGNMLRIRRAATATVGAAAAAVLLFGSPANAANTGNSATGGAVRPASARIVPSASVSFRISNARCHSTSITFTATTQENGRSGVQQFRQTAVLQEFRFGSWHTRASASRKSVRFPNDSRNFAFTLNWTGSHPANGSSWREVWQGFYLNGSGNVLFKTRK
jgi:hypothetical protein